MPRIDAFIQSIRDRGAERLIIASGSKAVLAGKGESIPVSAQPVPLQQVRAFLEEEIAAGTYDTQEKWEAALERMMERLHGD